MNAPVEPFGLDVAKEAARVLDLLGRGLVLYPDGEAAAEVVSSAAEGWWEGERAAGRDPGLSEFPQSYAGLCTPLRPQAAHDTARADLLRALGGVAISGDVRRLAGMRAAVGIAARFLEVLACAPGSRPWRAWMVTLTYRGVDDWRPQDVRDAVQRFRQWCVARGVQARYVWVAELQQRGALHYHLVVWLPHGLRMPKWDLPRPGSGRAWWPHGMTQRALVRRSAVGYLMKYLSKGTCYAGFPRGARAYGSGGSGQHARQVCRWVRMPAFIRSRSDVTDHWVRRVGGGWVAPGGEWFPSEWVVVRACGSMAVVRVLDHGRPFEADGPYSRLAGGGV